MSFDLVSQSVLATRRLFEQVFADLPVTEFDPSWLNAEGEFTPAVTLAVLPYPAVSVDPVSKRRLMLIPTHSFGTVVLHDRWGDRGAAGPLAAAHPIEFDMIDHDLKLVAVNEKRVELRFKLTGEVVESEALTPVFDRVLKDLVEGNGKFVKFCSSYPKAA